MTFNTISNKAGNLPPEAVLMFRSTILIVITVLTLSLPGNILAFTGMDYREEETINRELHFSDDAGTREIVVDNINGYIDVQGYEGDAVQLSVERVINARSEERMDAAKEEVRLDITEAGDSIKLYVDGPFRENNDRINYRGARYYGYENTFNFTLKIPHGTDIYLKAVNNGEITVKDTDGHFEVESINGSIDMTAIRGSGKIYALNGHAFLEFDENPRKSCYFGSLNGKVRINFRDPLNADLFFKTFNGEILTNLEVETLPESVWANYNLSKSNNSENKDPNGREHRHSSMHKSRKKYEAHGIPNGVRSGDGGVILEFDAFNGDIEVVGSQTGRSG